jgi:selenoprotein W-related protein
MASPRVEITYCTKCRFMLRAGWMAQELLTTFADELGEVALRPGSGGIFEVTLDGEVIASNRGDRQMPDPGQVKRLIRDRIAPERKIGHDGDS